MKPFLGSLLTLLVLLLGAAGFIYSGAVDIAADSPHYAPIQTLVETARERAIARRAGDIPVPVADDPGQLAEGAEHYSAMCAGCHLAPGMRDTEIRQGLYPQPPDLAEDPDGHDHDNKDVEKSAARQFWIIKHGIKASGMPAWGKSHEDDSIWAIVAFVQKLPEMSEAEYATLTAGVAEHQHDGGHSHSHAVEIPDEETVEAAPDGHSHELAEHDHGASVPSPGPANQHGAAGHLPDAQSPAHDAHDFGQ